MKLVSTSIFKQILFVLAVLYCDFAFSQSPNFCSDGSISYESYVKPLLEDKCGSCHFSNPFFGGFNANTYDSLILGGNICGNGVVPFLPSQSSLIDKTQWVVSGNNPTCGSVMPLSGTPLTVAEFNNVSQWIANGAKEKCAEIEVTFEVDMNCSNTNLRPPNITGPSWNWCGNCNIMTEIGSSDIWEISFNFAPEDSVIYKYVVGNFSSSEFLVDDMIAGGNCATDTDFMFFANRVLVVGNGNETQNDTYGKCGSCNDCVSNLTFNNVVQITGTYQADDWIESSAIVNSNSGGPVFYEIGDFYIELKNDFDTNGTVDFNCIILDCDLNN